MLRYVEHKDIDKTKWDKCVEEAENGFIFNQSFFLDGLCKWDAIVENDYEMVMALPFKKKYSIKYIYNPYFVSQLGIVGKKIITKTHILSFLNTIPTVYKYIDIHLNELNPIEDYKEIKTTIKINYILPLQNNYDKIFNAFSKDAKKNIQKGIAGNLKISSKVSLEDVFIYYKKAYGNLNEKISNKNYSDFYNTCNNAIKKGNGFIVGIENNNNELVATGFFGIDNKRIYYLLGAPTENGRKYAATHFLINEVIKKYAASNLTFDFEGSNIKNVADFYKKFSPLEKKYRHITINKLPKIIQLFKK